MSGQAVFFSVRRTAARVGCCRASIPRSPTWGARFRVQDLGRLTAQAGTWQIHSYAAKQATTVQQDGMVLGRWSCRSVQ